jgi:hypothetical protein
MGRGGRARATPAEVPLTRAPLLGEQGTGRRGTVTHRIGRIWIRRTGLAYDVMFAPTGNGEFRIATAAELRAFLWEATIPPERIDEALDALRHDTEHEIPNVMLTLERMSKLGL